MRFVKLKIERKILPTRLTISASSFTLATIQSGEYVRELKIEVCMDRTGGGQRRDRESGEGNDEEGGEVLVHCEFVG